MTINLHSLSENSVIDSQTDIKFIQILAGSLNVLWLPQFHRETVPISAYDIYMYIIMAMHTGIAMGLSYTRFLPVVVTFPFCLETAFPFVFLPSVLPCFLFVPRSGLDCSRAKNALGSAVSLGSCRLLSSE